MKNNMTEDKKYKVKHHVATGPYSFFEVEVEETMKTLVSQARWLSLQFKDKDVV